MGKQGSHLVSIILSLVLVLLLTTGISAADDPSETGSERIRTKTQLSGELPQKSMKSPEKRTGPLPKIVFKETEHDFGTEISGAELKHTFSFKNEGEGTLFIEKVKAG